MLTYILSVGENNVLFIFTSWLHHMTFLDKLHLNIWKSFKKKSKQI